MRQKFKRFCAAMLIFVMTVSLLPGPRPAQAAELTQEDYSAADAVFDRIDALEFRWAKRSTTQEQLTDAAAIGDTDAIYLLQYILLPEDFPL